MVNINTKTTNIVNKHKLLERGSECWADVIYAGQGQHQHQNQTSIKRWKSAYMTLIETIKS